MRAISGGSITASVRAKSGDTDAQRRRVYVQICAHYMSVCVCVTPPPPAEPTHVSSVVRASAAFPSPWMDSMAVE